jgi:glycosyltransferase involved in cell wall biosynthesis
LVLVGEGEERAELEIFTKNKKIQNIHFLPFQDQASLRNLYQNASLFVLPSFQET